MTRVRLPRESEGYCANADACLPDTKEEDLIHPEDIAHFKKHDEMDAAAERQEQLDRMQIVESNIPQKFRRQ